MIRTFLTTQAGATFHETSPRFTMAVRKETVEVIYRMDRGRYVVIHLFHSDFDRVVMLAHWGHYFLRFSNPTVQLPRLRQTCPTLAAVLEGTKPDGIERLRIDGFVDGLGLEVEVEPQQPLWLSLTPAHLPQLECLISTNQRIYNELLSQPPFLAWKDDLEELWCGK